MCIRDRLKEIGMTDKGWVDDFNLHYESVDRSFERGQTFHNFNDHDYMAVSYTHLDVYKRQSLRRRLLRADRGLSRRDI